MKKNWVVITVIALIAVVAVVLIAANIKTKQNNPNTNISGNKTPLPIQNDQNVEKEAEVTLYYPNDKYIETGDQNLDTVVPVKKKVKYKEGKLEETALSELFANRTIDGLTTGIPQDVKLIGIQVKDGLAEVNLSSQGLSGGSLQEELTIDQIVSTLTDLSGINKVQFLVDGKKVESLMGQADATRPFVKKKKKE